MVYFLRTILWIGSAEVSLVLGQFGDGMGKAETGGLYRANVEVSGSKTKDTRHTECKEPNSGSEKKNGKRR